MVKLHEGSVYLVHGSEIVPASESARVEQLTGKAANQEEAKKGTIAYGIMKSHNTAETMDQVRCDGIPRYHLRRHHPDCTCIRYGEVPASIRADLLP